MHETVLNIKRAKQVIRLDGSPDSPRFVLDLTSGAVQQSATVIYNRWRAVDAAAATEDEQAALFRETVSDLLGEEAWGEIRAWITEGDEGLTDYDIALLVAPLANYLIDQVNEVVSLNQSAAFAKYLGAHEAEIV